MTGKLLQIAIDGIPVQNSNMSIIHRYDFPYCYPALLLTGWPILPACLQQTYELPQKQASSGLRKASQILGLTDGYMYT